MGWIVADCTGEGMNQDRKLPPPTARLSSQGLKGALICKFNSYTPTPLSDERLFDAVDLLLKMQNS
jgi:lanosterol synthase